MASRYLYPPGIAPRSAARTPFSRRCVGPTLPQAAYTNEDVMPSYDAADDLVRIEAARAALKRDCVQLEERLALRRQESSRMKEDLRTLGLL